MGVRIERSEQARSVIRQALERTNMAENCEHIVTAEPIIKMDGGIIGFSFTCSCGRKGKGCHETEIKAIERGQDHILYHSLKEARQVYADRREKWMIAQGKADELQVLLCSADLDLQALESQYERLYGNGS